MGPLLGIFIENTCLVKTSRPNNSTMPSLSLSFHCSNIIKREGTHFLALAHMDCKLTFMHTAETIFFSLSLTLARSVCLPLSYISMKCVCSLSQRQVTKFFMELLCFPLIWIQSSEVHVGSRLASSAAQRANCVLQHHSVTWWLTNALDIVVFDRGRNVQTEFPAPLITHLTPCDVAMGALSWVLMFWWRSVSRLVRMLFWSLLSGPSELTLTQLAWVEPVGVHRELKDMDLCQRISYIAHILQVQLRIRDSGHSPLAAHPTICPPGAGGSVA